MLRPDRPNTAGCPVWSETLGVSSRHRRPSVRGAAAMNFSVRILEEARLAGHSSHQEKEPKVQRAESRDVPGLCSSREDSPTTPAPLPSSTASAPRPQPPRTWPLKRNSRKLSITSRHGDTKARSAGNVFTGKLISHGPVLHTRPPVRPRLGSH